MDKPTQYYVDKRQKEDQFYERLDPADVEILRSAFRWMLIAPLATLGFLMFIKSLRNHA